MISLVMLHLMEVQVAEPVDSAALILAELISVIFLAIFLVISLEAEEAEAVVEQTMAL